MYTISDVLLEQYKLLEYVNSNWVIAVDVNNIWYCSSKKKIFVSI